MEGAHDDDRRALLKLFITRYAQYMAHPHFVHPVSHVPLTKEDGGWRCPETQEFFPIHEGVPVFVPQDLNAHMEKERGDLINNVKTLLRKWPGLYIFLIFLISPVCFTGVSAKRFLKKFKSDALVLNIGSGVHTFRGNVLNLDIFYYKGVHVVANAEELPFADNSVDAIICESLLEHVPQPQVIVDDMLRVLKPGGQMYIVIPFVYPFHACPNDFYRWSSTGLRHLCKDGDVKDLGTRAGPSSALMGQLSTWAAIACSFGSTSLYNIFSLLFPLVLFPIKFLDLIFGWFPTSIHGAGQFYAIVEKKPL
jgi:SAM-dependent methyltransferase